MKSNVESFEMMKVWCSHLPKNVATPFFFWELKLDVFKESNEVPEGHGHGSECSVAMFVDFGVFSIQPLGWSMLKLQVTRDSNMSKTGDVRCLGKWSSHQLLRRHCAARNGASQCVIVWIVDVSLAWYIHIFHIPTDTQWRNTWICIQVKSHKEGTFKM